MDYLFLKALVNLFFLITSIICWYVWFKKHEKDKFKTGAKLLGFGAVVNFVVMEMPGHIFLYFFWILFLVEILAIYFFIKALLLANNSNNL